MYEELSYEMILKRMLGAVLENNPNLDTREGSIIFDALAPAAMELKMLYLQLDVILEETFADTASREMLIRRVAERGITPYKETKAVLRGEFDMNVPLGARFSLEKYNYVVVDKIEHGVFSMECETFGRVGNIHFGTLIPVDYIQGLGSAELTQLLIPGEDDEDTEQLRKRYFKSLDSEAFGGNLTDYKEKTRALSGVGGVKVYPVWNGGGTVKLVIINSENTAPSAALIDVVQTAIDPMDGRGAGFGIAPIGHIVTVLGVSNTNVNIATNITYQTGWNWEDIRIGVETMLDDYFKELSANWSDEEQIIVRISQIEIRLLEIVGVVDVSGTTINTLEQNFTLGIDNIPVRGEIVG